MGNTLGITRKIILIMKKAENIPVGNWENEKLKFF